MRHAADAMLPRHYYYCYADAMRWRARLLMLSFRAMRYARR